MKKLFLTNDYKTYSKLPKYNSSIIYRKEIGEVLYNHDIHNLSSKYEYFTVEPLISDENLYYGISINNRTSDYYNAEIPGKYRIISENNIGEWQNMSKTTVPLRPNEKIQFSIETFRYANYSPFILNGYGVFYRISGNILSLIYGDNFIDNLDNTSNTYNFKNLFRYMTSILYADRLYLPSYMCEGCFESMFEGCTNLITAPNFSNTSFGEYSCNRMFYNCISLQTAPEIYAMITASDCFNEMFYNCVNLNELTLFTCQHTTGYECTTDMLYNVNKNCQIYHNNSNISSSITGYGTLINGFNYKTYKNVKFIIFNYTDSDTPSSSETGTLNDVKCYISDSVFNWDEFVNSKYNINNNYTITQNINIDISNYLANEYENYIIYYKDKPIWSVTNDILFRPTWPNEATETYGNIYYITDNIPGNVEETYFINDRTDYSKEYFTIHVLGDGDLTLYMPLSYTTAPSYSVNGGNWNTFTSNTTLSLKTDDKVRIKCVTGAYQRSSEMFNSTCEYEVYGNIMSLIYGDDFEGQTSLVDKYYTFYYLFSYSDTLKSAKNLILPATTLANDCYGFMFYCCTYLTEAPQLPAITLTDWCYSHMFMGCTSLTTAPNLPATTITTGCYFRMFESCRKLIAAPTLPVTTLAERCYANMFYDCSSLTTAPELLATTLVDGCYSQMFEYCSKLSYIKMLATDISAKYCLDNWVNGVASSGTFIKHPDMTSLTTGTSGIPSGWTIVNDGETNTETNLITFYINDIQCQAEEGMTWADWYISDMCNEIIDELMNPPKDDIYNHLDYTVIAAAGWILLYNNIDVKFEDYIQKEWNYQYDISAGDY